MGWPTFDEVFPRMESAKEMQPDADGSKRFICACPAHEDDRPSLVVIESARFEGRAIFHCHAGCSKEDICTAFGFSVAEQIQHSLQRPATRQHPGSTQFRERRHGEEYEYKLADGSLNFVVTRLMEPRKSFRQHRIDTDTGIPIPNLRGVERSIYRLERLMSRSPLAVLYIVEGEHDVLNLEILDKDATTKSGGANAPWSPSMLEQIRQLRPDEIRIVVDMDDAGEKAGGDLFRLLDGLGLFVRMFSPSPLVADALGHKGADITDHLEAGFPLAALSEITPEKVSVADPEIPVVEASPLDLTETGAAIYLEQAIGDRVMYVPGLDEPWHYLRDGIWVSDRDEVDALAREAFESRVLAADAAGDNRLLRASMRFACRRGIESALILMRNSVKVQVAELGELANPHLVAVANGIIDLRVENLLPHDPALRFTMQVNSKFVEDAECPRWLAFLEEVQPDPDVRKWLQRFFGACLTGEMPQIVVCNIGAGLNGKSVAINTVMSVLGPYAGVADASTFMSGKSLNANEQRSDLTRLRGKRMVSATETDAGASLDEGFIKSWCGGEEIIARAMYARTHIRYEPQGKLVLTSNHKPRIKEQDLGVWRRIRLIPWSVRIKKVDDGIQAKLRKESVGILRWLVEGARKFYDERRLMKQGLDDLPAAIRDATSEYKIDEDEIGEFIIECCEEGVDNRILSADLYLAYVEWSNAERVRPMSKNKFGRRLTQRGLMSSRSATNPEEPDRKAGSRQWDGIRLQSPF